MVKAGRWVQGLAVVWMLGGGAMFSGVASSGVAQAPAGGMVAGAAVAWVPVAMPAAAPAVTKFFPLAEVKRGMKGVAYTVFEGVNPEPMQVEILGLLKDALGPGQDMILSRLHGDKPEYTGVVAGMSGSPVILMASWWAQFHTASGPSAKSPLPALRRLARCWRSTNLTTAFLRRSLSLPRSPALRRRPAAPAVPMPPDSRIMRSTCSPLMLLLLSADSARPPSRPLPANLRLLESLP